MTKRERDTAVAVWFIAIGASLILWATAGIAVWVISIGAWLIFQGVAFIVVTRKPDEEATRQ